MSTVVVVVVVEVSVVDLVLVDTFYKRWAQRSCGLCFLLRFIGTFACFSFVVRSLSLFLSLPFDTAWLRFLLLVVVVVLLYYHYSSGKK